MYLVRHVLKGLVPGVEGQAGLESIGQSEEVELRLLGFYPRILVRCSAVSAFVDVFVPVHTDAAIQVAAGHPPDFRPLLLIGVSL